MMTARKQLFVPLFALALYCVLNILGEYSVSDPFSLLGRPKKEGAKVDDDYLEHDCQKSPLLTSQAYEFLDQKRKRKLSEMRKLIAKFELSPDELGFQKG